MDKANIGYYDYSAVIYLKTCVGGGGATSSLDCDDSAGHFTGGEFTFVDPTGDEIVEPRAGRVVLFASGCEHVHAVKPMKQGTRMSIGMWFTLSPEGAHAITPEERGTAKFRLVSGLGRDLPIDAAYIW